MIYLLYFLICLMASIVGAICGIGGGVVIKPVLDMMQMGPPATINFLSGCTVLSMSLYSVSKALRAGDSKVEMSTGTPLALGAAVGGVVGKEMFSAVKTFFNGSPMVGGVQAVALGIITLGTLLYTINKSRIQTRNTSNKLACLVIGLLLGIMSSFLGIGGGPINLVVLGYFFGMDSKTAAANSLYIILFSQSASLLATVLTASVPEFQIGVLLLMVAGGIGGGIVGRTLNKKMDNKAVDKLFIGLMVLIVCICIYNAARAFIG
ncbi:MAG: sulfite exporter TauE/SafE family protein [Oscillospiraceae bacterium]|nr:sulfite exporter TauE/SafE family protein [Oscillospiraceae bacterium]